MHEWGPEDASVRLAPGGPAQDVAGLLRLPRGTAAPIWLAAAVADHWGLPEGARITLLAVSENATFRVDAPDGARLVLRVQRPGYVAGAAAVESELSWVEAIARDTDVTVPVALPGRDGARVLTVPAPGGSVALVVAFPFVEGEVLEDVADPLDWFATIGRTTARLHRHTRAWARPAGFTRFSWELADMVGPACRWGSWTAARLEPGERRLLEDAEAAALSIVGELGHDPGDWGLIHSDLRPSNIMVDGGRLTVIDFDDSGFGWYLYDFAAAMTWLDHRPDAPGLAQAWVAGYRGELPFTAADARRACAFNMLRRLMMLGWCTTHRPDAVPAEIRGRVTELTCVVADRYLTHPLWLLED